MTGQEAGGSRLAPSATAHCSPLRRKCRGFRPPVFRSAWFAVRLLPGARTLRVTDPPLRNSTDPSGAGQGGEDTAPYGQEHRPAGFSAPPQGRCPGRAAFSRPYGGRGALRPFTSPGRIGQGGEDTAPYGQEHPGRFQRTPTGGGPATRAGHGPAPTGAGWDTPCNLPRETCNSLPQTCNPPPRMCGPSPRFSSYATLPPLRAIPPLVCTAAHRRDKLFVILAQNISNCTALSSSNPDILQFVITVDPSRAAETHARVWAWVWSSRWV